MDGVITWKTKGQKQSHFNHPEGILIPRRCISWSVSYCSEAEWAQANTVQAEHLLGIKSAAPCLPSCQGASITYDHTPKLNHSLITYMSTIIDVFEELIQYLAGASDTIRPQKSITPSNVSITPHYMLWPFGLPLQRQLQDTILSLITEQESPLSYKNWERHTVRFTPVDSSGAWSLAWQNASEL